MIEIIMDERLAYSPAFVFVMEQFVDLLHKGHADQSLCMTNSMRVVYAKNASGVVGACVFDLDYSKGQAWIYMAAVDDDYRHQGIYQQIYSTVEDICISEGMRSIGSNVSVYNSPMIDFAIKNDREMRWFKTTKRL